MSVEKDIDRWSFALTGVTFFQVGAEMPAVLTPPIRNSVWIKRERTQHHHSSLPYHATKYIK